MTTRPKTGGRKKGTPNRVSASIRESVLQVYEGLQEEAGGNNQHLLNWPKQYPTEFYRICAKMIPTPIKAEITNPLRPVNELTDEELRFIAGGGDGSEGRPMLVKCDNSDLS